MGEVTIFDLIGFRDIGTREYIFVYRIVDVILIIKLRNSRQYLDPDLPPRPFPWIFQYIPR